MSVDTAFFDPTTAQFAVDPHPLFDALRAEHAVVRDPLGWSTLDYATSAAAFDDRALTPGIDHLLVQRGIGSLWGEPGHTLTDSEGDAHRRLRQAVSPWFSARRIGLLRERTAALVDELLDGADLTDGAPFDVMSGLAHVVPARLFCWMVGAPDSDAPDLARLSKVLLSVFTATAEMVEPVRAAGVELAAYTRRLLLDASSGGDDLTSALVAAERDGRLLSGDAFFLLEELLSASVDNTANTTGLAAFTLAGRPDEWRRLHADADAVPAAVDECGRFEPAIRHTIKCALEPTTIGGQAIAAGELVTVRIAAANRDPAMYVEPHRFWPDRPKAKAQLAFGAGRHYCLGAALGRMEVAEMIHGLTARWSSVEIDEGVVMDRNVSGIVDALPLHGVQ